MVGVSGTSAALRADTSTPASVSQPGPITAIEGLRLHHDHFEEIGRKDLDLAEDRAAAAGIDWQLHGAHVDDTDSLFEFRRPFDPHRRAELTARQSENMRASPGRACSAPT